MIKEDAFKRSLFISVFLHLVLFLPWPNLIHFRQEFREEKASQPPIIVAYKISMEELKLNETKEQMQVEEQEAKEEREGKVEREESVALAEKEVEETEEEMEKEQELIEGERQVYHYLEELDGSRGVVDLSEVASTAHVPEAVLDYYNAIREEIRKKAFYYKPRLRGYASVTVLFTLSSDGMLQALEIDEASSVGTKIFRESALRSVKYAAPFPPFPPELKDDRITFSITIEFDLRGGKR